VRQDRQDQPEQAEPQVPLAGLDLLVPLGPRVHPELQAEDSSPSVPQEHPDYLEHRVVLDQAVLPVLQEERDSRVQRDRPEHLDPLEGQE